MATDTIIRPVQAASSPVVEETFEVTVVIGRFQLLHKAHLALVKTALRLGKRVIVFIGSAFHARTPKNCFMWSERESMLRLCLTDEENSRLTCVPIRDYGDNAKWASVLEKKVKELVGDTTSIRAVGHYKDASSEYLDILPWDVIDTGKAMDIDATSMRKVLYETEDITAALAVMAPYVPAPVLQYLKGWSQLPHLQNLKDEYFHLKGERERHKQPYGLTGDFIFRYGDYVLMVRRKNWPGKGLYAWPGGFWEPERRETLRQCAEREAREETTHSILAATIRRAFKFAKMFDAADRSVRPNIATMAHYYYIPGDDKVFPEVVGCDDVDWAGWVHISEFLKMEEQMYDDHFAMGVDLMGLSIDD